MANLRSQLARWQQSQPMNDEELHDKARDAYQAFAKVNHGEFYNSGMGGVNERY